MSPHMHLRFAFGAVEKSSTGKMATLNGILEGFRSARVLIRTLLIGPFEYSLQLRSVMERFCAAVDELKTNDALGFLVAAKAFQGIKVQYSLEPVTGN